MMHKKLVTLSLLAILVALPITVAAAETPGEWFQGIIDRLLDIVILPLFAGVVVIMLLYAGFLFVTAQGDPTKIATAKKAVVWALVGIGVGLLSYAMVGFIKKIVEPDSSQECSVDPDCGANGACNEGVCSYF